MPLNVIDTLKPKNEGSFPIAEAVDIAVTAEKRLPEVLADKADQSALNATNAAVAAKATTADLTAATTNLQSQIDELITPVTQDAEVQNARVDVDGNSFTTLKARCDADQNDLANLKDKIYNADAGYQISEIPNVTAEPDSSASVTNTASRVGILIVANSSYDTYYFITSKSCDIYFDGVESAYLALCYGTYIKTEVEQDGIVLYASNPTRLRKSEGNLPTSANKLSVPSGTVIAITLTADSDDTIYGLSSDAINSTFAAAIVNSPGFTGEKTENKVTVITDANRESTTLYPTVKAVVDGIDSLSNEIFEEADNGKKISDITNVVKEAGYSGSKTTTAHTGVLLAENAGYDTYYVVLSEACEIYTKNVRVDYLAICYGSDFTEIIEDSGNKWLCCSNPNRVRKSESNLPTEENKLSLSAGSVVAFTVTAGANETIYGLGNQKVIKQSFKDEIISSKSKHIQYITGTGLDSSAEWVDVYMPTISGYIKYVFVHTEEPTINADVWRIAKAVHCDEDFSVIEDCTTTGEWECAVKLDGRPDFSGGFLHGDEVLDSITFFVDGAIVDITDFTTITEVESFKVIQTSNLYDPNDGTTVIARHGSEHNFTSKSLEISQSVTWRVAATVVNAYLAMFPPLKSLTDNLITNKDYEIVELPQVYEEADITSAILYSDTKKFSSQFDINDYPKGLSTTSNTFLCTDNNGNNYNKCYYTTVRGSSYSVSIGEEWKSNATYSITMS